MTSFTRLSLSEAAMPLWRRLLARLFSLGMLLRIPGAGRAWARTVAGGLIQVEEEVEIDPRTARAAVEMSYVHRR